MATRSEASGRRDSGAARAAMVLWVVVLVALAYGIFNTAISVVDLFTG